MSRHDQQVDDRHLTCSNCQQGNCTLCVDVLRMSYTDQTICRCTRKDHMGEATDNQIMDPETGAIYAPGLVVNPDGSVTFNER